MYKVRYAGFCFFLPLPGYRPLPRNSMITERINRDGTFSPTTTYVFPTYARMCIIKGMDQEKYGVYTTTWPGSLSPFLPMKGKVLRLSLHVFMCDSGYHITRQDPIEYNSTTAPKLQLTSLLYIFRNALVFKREKSKLKKSYSDRHVLSYSIYYTVITVLVKD